MAAYLRLENMQANNFSDLILILKTRSFPIISNSSCNKNCHVYLKGKCLKIKVLSYKIEQKLVYLDGNRMQHLVYIFYLPIISLVAGFGCAYTIYLSHNHASHCYFCKNYKSCPHFEFSYTLFVE